jgi:hypothetical protein
MHSASSAVDLLILGAEQHLGWKLNWQVAWSSAVQDLVINWRRLMGLSLLAQCAAYHVLASKDQASAKR